MLTRPPIYHFVRRRAKPKGGTNNLSSSNHSRPTRAALCARVIVLPLSLSLVCKRVDMQFIFFLFTVVYLQVSVHVSKFSSTSRRIACYSRGPISNEWERESRVSISSGPASLLDRTDVFFFLESTGLNFLFFF